MTTALRDWVTHNLISRTLVTPDLPKKFTPRSLAVEKLVLLSDAQAMQRSVSAIDLSGARLAFAVQLTRQCH